MKVCCPGCHTKMLKTLVIPWCNPPSWKDLVESSPVYALPSSVWHYPLGPVGTCLGYPQIWGPPSSGSLRASGWGALLHTGLCMLGEGVHFFDGANSLLHQKHLSFPPLHIQVAPALVQKALLHAGMRLQRGSGGMFWWSKLMIHQKHPKIPPTLPQAVWGGGLEWRAPNACALWPRRVLTWHCPF